MTFVPQPMSRYVCSAEESKEKGNASGSRAVGYVQSVGGDDIPGNRASIRKSAFED